jgi:hypothetical protein
MARDTGPAIFMITASPAPDSASGDAFKTLFDAKGFSSPIAGATSPSGENRSYPTVRLLSPPPRGKVQMASDNAHYEDPK